MKELRDLYKDLEEEIEKKLISFKKTGQSENKTVAEFCFCLLTPQSRAVLADKAVRLLQKNKYIQKGGVRQIRSCLKGVRFPNNKALYIHQAAKNILRKKGYLKKILSEKDEIVLRDILVKNVKGYGLKEASHFLRNIGRGKHIAILDRHILKELVKYKVIGKVPDLISSKMYFEIEEKMRKFSKKIKIPLDALDLILWYKETGYIFK